jgi:hypothetical protein
MLYVPLTSPMRATGLAIFLEFRILFRNLSMCVCITIHRCYWVLNTPAFYSTRPVYDYCPSGQLYSLRLVVAFLMHFRQVPGLYLETGPYQCFTRPFFFVIHNELSVHLTLHDVSSRWDFIKKQVTKQANMKQLSLPTHKVMRGLQRH